MKTNNPPFGTGAIPSPIDPRDWTPASVGAPTAFPESAFIERTLELNITNQGKIGSCVGNTYEEIVRLIQLVNTGSQEQLSWRWVYAICKALDGYAWEGTYVSLAAKVVRTYGVPLAKYCPNDISLEHEKFVFDRKLKSKEAIIAALGQEAWNDAQTRKAGADILFPNTEDGIKQAVAYAKANNGGVAIARRIGKEYWTNTEGVSSYKKSDLLPMRTPKIIVSGHAELLYGYDKDPQNGRTRIYWQNHWDKDWCSTSGWGTDGGRAWEYLDEWLPFITEVRVSVAALPPAPNDFKYEFTSQLREGMQGADVVALQRVLDIEGCYDYTGTPKYTGNFVKGGYTFRGVKKLQEKYAAEILTPLGLTQGTGLVGSSTLAWLKKHYSPNK